MDFFFTTIALPLATLLTIIGKILWEKLQLEQARRALEENTRITKQAAENARVAASHAEQAVSAAQDVAVTTTKALNGRLDQLVQAAYEKGMAASRQRNGSA